MFDLPLAERSTERFTVELPDDGEPWRIGLIVGPSGSGKSTVARAAYGDRLYQGAEWPADRAVIDALSPLGVRETIGLFTAVGFSSPPSWVKPYRVLSNGERFRCDLARALASNALPSDKPSQQPTANSQQPLVVFDEFTSVVDRTVAKVCSAAVARAVRGGRVASRFVAVTCHYDVAEWLEPDWTLDMATCSLDRRRLRRPDVRLEIHRCGVEAWRLFARHHYLSGSLAPQARCYLASWEGEPVAFAATIPLMGRRGRRRFTRIVTLPDYQGLGIGMKFVEAVAGLHHAEGLRVSVTSSHPALAGHCERSARWRTTAVRKHRKPSRADYRDSSGRMVASFEFVGTLE
jgi:GNAT superfamily N-acetyltransferase